jgi:protein O-GlcNAcase/histone acetyltransferase
MATHESTEFLAGVIEGFYGVPWSPAERSELFEWMSRWKLNTYLYCPKDDLKHRTIWREPYTLEEEAALRTTIEGCQRRGLRFIYGLGPGLDIRYGQHSELEHLRRRFQQVGALGGRDFALLFDDIPDAMEAADRQRWGSFAAAQCHVANTMAQWAGEHTPGGRFLFCPTPYCGRMAERQLGGEGYLETLGRELLPAIDVFWTGPEIISQEITVPHIRELGQRLRRKPIIWDNLHANDYDGRRFYCGPYAGRPRELCGEVHGLLSNPNNEFPLNYVPLRTLAEFVHGRGPWDPRAAFESALREWQPRFETVHGPLALEDLVLLSDAYYLPHEEGPEAENFFQAIAGLLAGRLPAQKEAVEACRAQAARLRQVCARTAEIRCRPLFYALSRRVWELREELDLLDRILAGWTEPGGLNESCSSDFHLPGTYRGGLASRLQQLLVQHADGTFTARRDLAGPPPGPPAGPAHPTTP